MSIAMPSSGCFGPWIALAVTILPGLVGEQVDRVRRVVPQQVVGPRRAPALGVHVLAAEEVGLHVHLLDRQLAGDDPVVHVLVARIEPPGVPDHAGEPGLLLLPQHRLGIAQRIRQRDLDLHVLARVMQAIACSACICVGVPGSPRRRRRARALRRARCPKARAPYLAANFGRLLGAARDDETISTPSMFCRPSRCFSPKAPAPARAMRMRLLQCRACHSLPRQPERVAAGSSRIRCARQRVFERRARGRSGVDLDARRCLDLSPSAPRTISHMTSSMPSEPASRRYWMCGISLSSSGSLISLSMNGCRSPC